MAIIIVGHGDMPDAAKFSIKMITGLEENIFAVSITPDQGNEALQRQLDEILTQNTETTRWLIFTDLLGGSPNNLVTTHMFQKSGVQIISGFNLPMLLSAVLNPNQSSDQLLKEGKRGIKDVIKKLRTVDTDEE